MYPLPIPDTALRRLVNNRSKAQPFVQEEAISHSYRCIDTAYQRVKTMSQNDGTAQELKLGKTIFVVNHTDVTHEKLAKGAEKTEVQYLIDERHGSTRFALRIYTIQKGGHTPLDQHQYEHQVYILKGEGFLRQSKNPDSPLKNLKPGDAVFIPSNAVHQFSNGGDEPLVFLCVKGNPQLYTQEAPTTNPAPEQNFC